MPMANTPAPTHTTSMLSTTPQKPIINPIDVTNGQIVGGGGFSGRGAVDPIGTRAGSAGEAAERVWSFVTGSVICDLRFRSRFYRTRCGDGLIAAIGDSLSSGDSPNQVPSRIRIAPA
jgi:hypothetical protein